jgi:ribosomal protein S5
MKAAQGDEKFLMKDINCEYEYDMLKRLRARAERDKIEEAVIKIQRFWKTVKTKRLFKFIVRH